MPAGIMHALYNKYSLDNNSLSAAIIDPVSLCGVHIPVSGGKGDIDVFCLLRPPARSFLHSKLKVAIQECQHANNCASLRLKSHLAALSRSARGAAEAAFAKVG